MQITDAGAPAETLVTEKGATAGEHRTDAGAPAKTGKAARPSSRAPRRAYGLDALRGLAILAMILAGLVPTTLPPWMYHAQVPPPDMTFHPDLPGITWVDLVFPFFLLSMGAAIPLALSRRLAKGVPLRQLLVGILWRGVLLCAFAYFRNHVSPFDMASEPGRREWALGLAAMAFVFLIWGRFPDTWNKWLVAGIRAAGWAGVLLFLMQLDYPDHARLAWTMPRLRQWFERTDIIILVLANVSVFGSLIWLCTRGKWLARLAPVGLMFALRLSSMEPGWGKTVWAATPASWLYRMEFLKYLMIILPGTIIGDMLVDWMASKKTEERPAWGTWRLAAIGLVSFAFMPVLVVGLKGRWVVETSLVTLGVGLLGYALTLRPRTDLEQMLARMYQWGAYWLALGLILEPVEGGIKKDHTTFSYFFVTMGLGILALIAFTVLTDALGKRRAVQLLVDNGQNPLLAYVGAANFVLPVMVLAGANGWLDRALTTPWQGALHAGILTLLLAICVSLCTKMKVFVRA